MILFFFFLKKKLLIIHFITHAHLALFFHETRDAQSRLHGLAIAMNGIQAHLFPCIYIQVFGLSIMLNLGKMLRLGVFIRIIVCRLFCLTVILFVVYFTFVLVKDVE